MQNKSVVSRSALGILVSASIVVLMVCLCSQQAHTALPRESRIRAYQFLAQQMDRFSNFYVYSDKGAPGNHFPAKGWMGDYGDIRLDEAYRTNPRRGGSCISITYTATGEQGNGWAGIYWHLHWGDGRAGYDLRPANRLTFWARGEKGGEVAEFKVGGIEGQFPDADRAPVRRGPGRRQHGRRFRLPG